jgi:flagellar FliL protein
MSSKAPKADKKDKEKDGAAEGAEPTKKSKFSGKKLVLFIVLPVLLLAIGGGVGGWFYLDGKKKAAEEAAAQSNEPPPPPPPKPSLFVDLPEMLINLNTGTRQAAYLKMRIALEVDDPETVKKLEEVMPRVLDSFQTFLRELRTDDLSGSAGLYRVKEELLVRISSTLQPMPVKDVLFKEMLVH